MDILLAFDKFKGTLTGEQISDIVRGVLRSRLPEARLRSVLLADGGDGTLQVVLTRGFDPVSASAVDALGQPKLVQVGLDGHSAFIEMAAICGLAEIPPDQRDGLRSTSLGLGMAARSVLDLGVDDITIGLGGSASTDGGLGFLTGLGVRVLDSEGRLCTPDLLGLDVATTLDLTGLHERAAACRWTFLADVNSPLLGARGAARTFGPQKGLSQADVELAEAALSRWAHLVHTVVGRDDSRRPGAGAAGGIIVGAAVLGEPRIASGAEYVADLISLDAEIARADLVITGEGHLDKQSMLGKGPGMVLERARLAGVPAVVLAGRIDLDALPSGVVVATSLEAVSGSVEQALQEPARWLDEAAHRVVNECESAGLLAGITVE